MPTEIRPELSKKNKYWIPKHRYYELKHFVMQYPDWDLYIATTRSYAKACKHEGRVTEISDPVYRTVEKRLIYTQNKDLCKKVANNTDPLLGREILAAIILEESYEKVKARHDIPCCKDVWYDLYHKFFWLLDAARK